MSKAYGTVPTIEGQIVQPGDVLPAVRNKVGHSCCGGCCDVKRAVIAVNLVSIGMLLINLFAFSAVATAKFDDAEAEQVVSNVHPGVLVFIFIVEIVLLLVAIWGAHTFSASKVMAGIIVYAIASIFFLIPFNLAGLLINLLFAYPHVFLYNEIKSGVMTIDNYYNEEQSCCCV